MMARQPWEERDWPEDKSGPEYLMHKDRVERDAQKPAARFPVIQVSSAAQELVADLEIACLTFAATLEPNVEARYAELSQRRRELYQYLATLEFNARIKRDVTLRFE